MKFNFLKSFSGLINLMVFAIVFAISFPLAAAVRLPGVLTSNMVLQRNKEIKIWGWADKSEKVTVQFNNKTLSAKADETGSWTIKFPAMKEGGPYAIIIKGKNTITLDNILIGDVYICSGQSNMEWVVKNSNNSAAEIANSDYPQIRLLTIPKNFQLSPVNNIAGIDWKVCSPESVGNFSAVGYFFGRDLYKAVNIPIGLINTSWGGTNVEAWISGDFIKTVEEFKDKVNLTAIVTPEELETKRVKKIEYLYTTFNLDPLKKTNTDNWNQKDIDLKGWKDIEVPGLWEKGELESVDGVIYFRKEVNIPENLVDKDWTLKLGKIDDSDKTFVNAKLVGETNGYSELREYVIKAGTFNSGINLIIVRVEDMGGGGGFWSAKEEMQLTCGNTTIPLNGTWKCRLSTEGFMLSSASGEPNSNPASLFNGMINPLLNLAVTGAIWYQGESNASRAYQYRKLFPLMIDCWRAKWNQDDLNFFFVQLANFMAADEKPIESEWAELREAQSMTLSLPKTGMAVTIDIGEEKDIHPRNKQDVGYRLSLQALNTVYGKPVVSNGPVYKSMQIDGERITLSFETQGSSLKAKDKYGYLKGFAVAGEDKVFYWAKARIRGNDVNVSSDMVKSPVAVRYAWANNPADANLYNEEGIPASPFRTDDWQGITFDSK